MTQGANTTKAIVLLKKPSMLTATIERGPLVRHVVCDGTSIYKGFEIVGISLDQPNSKEKVLKFTQDKQMPWRQIYDGKYWQADNAVSFGIQAIPFTLLIGKDGKIAAVGARGEALAPAIEAALKK